MPDWMMKNDNTHVMSSLSVFNTYGENTWFAKKKVNSTKLNSIQVKEKGNMLFFLGDIFQLTDW